MSERWREKKRKIQKRERWFALAVTAAVLLYALTSASDPDRDDARPAVFLWFGLAPITIWWISIGYRWWKERAEAPPPTDAFD